MVSSPDIADELAQVIPHFNILADASRTDPLRTLDIAMKSSKKLMSMMCKEMVIFGLVKGNDGHQAYYTQWCVALLPQ